MSTSITQRTSAVLGAFALAAVAVFGAAAPASAAEVGNIDENASASLTIHKLAQPATATGLANDGTELTPAQLTGLTALEDVGFEIARITNIDLTTNEGWAAVDGLTAAEVLADAAAYPLEFVDGGATDADGELPFAGLELGVYLVTETSPGPNAIAEPAVPFLVTLPLSTGDNSWIYDVHVYPKNAVTAVNKTVDDSTAYGIGDDVTWTITAQVPNLAAGQTVDSFVITDVLDTRLEFTSATVTFADASGDAVVLAAGDYTVVAPAVGSNGTVTVTFSDPTGLAKLQANQGDVVTVELVTEVASIGDGTIENSATVQVNDSTHTSPSATTSWGVLDIFAHTDDSAETPLAGAQYSIYPTEQDAIDGTNEITVNGESVFETGTDGHVIVTGIRVGDYFVAEIAPPVGYTSNTSIIGVEITAGTAGTADFPYGQTPAWMLPLTGGDGTLWFGLGGTALLVIAVGAGVLIAARRRKVTEALAQS